MEHIQQIKRDHRISQALNDRADKRKLLVHQVADFYNTRGPKFIKDLEKLLVKYENSPKYTGVDIINELSKRI